MKDVGLRIRVQKELREQFQAACQAHDKPAAQVLREFMRDYVAANSIESPVVTGAGQMVTRSTTGRHHD